MSTNQKIVNKKFHILYYVTSHFEYAYVCATAGDDLYTSFRKKRYIIHITFV